MGLILRLLAFLVLLAAPRICLAAHGEVVALDPLSLAHSPALRAVAVSGPTPVLDQPSSMTVAAGSTADQIVRAVDPDGDAITFSKAFGPAYMTVSTIDPGIGVGTGSIHLAPQLADIGVVTAGVAATDGVLYDQRSFVISATPGGSGSVAVEEQPVIDATLGGLVIGGVYEQKLAQVVRVPLSGVLTEVGLPVACSSGHLTIEIQGLTAGFPNGNVLATRVVSHTELPAFYPDAPYLRPILLPAPPGVEAGMQFAIVLRSEGECGIFQGPAGNPYPYGDGYFDSRPNPVGVWVPLGNPADLPFRVTINAAGQNAVPHADAGGPYVGVTGMPIEFDGTGSFDQDSDPLDYVWSFGDGTVGMGENASHSYGTGGTYAVTLTVTDTGTPPLSATSSTTATVHVPGTPLFAEAISFGVTGDPTSVAISDFNSDTRQDLIVTRSFFNSVSVFPGHGDGTYGTGVDYAAGSYPIAVAVGDLNSDALPDLTVANLLSSNVSVLLGRRDGTLGERTDYPTGSYPWSVAIGDLNHDGWPDLAVANNLSSTVSILLGNGDGTFGAKTDYETGFSPTSVAIGALNGDGRPDLAVATQYAVDVHLGNGDGTFGAATEYAAGDYPHSVAIGDLNHDGRQDLAVANVGANTVSVLRGAGDGTFGLKEDHATGSQPWFVVIEDLNGDGHPDLVVADYGSGAVSVLPGNANGTSEGKIDYLTGDYPQFVAIGDLDMDGRPDIAVANSSNTISLLLNRTAITTSGLTADIDVDPNVINLKGKGPWVTVYIEPMGFDPSSIDVSTVRLAGSVPPAPKLQVLGDHNGNGAPDLMVRFSREALDPLLTPGTDELVLTGSLVNGEPFEGRDEVRVIHPGNGNLSASVVPNPLNPVGVLRFSTSMPGPVNVTMFDVQGRIVRVLMDTRALPMGTHTLPIDARGAQGQALATGVYFYRIETAQGSTAGRIAVVK
jgi:hypothetical protein